MRTAALLACLTFFLPAVLAAPGQAVPSSDNAATGLLARSSSGIDVAHRSIVDSTSHNSLFTRDIPGITEEDVKAIAKRFQPRRVFEESNEIYIKHVVADAYASWPHLNWLIFRIRSINGYPTPMTSKLDGQEGTHWGYYILNEISSAQYPNRIPYLLYGVESGTMKFETSDRDNLWTYAGLNVTVDSVPVQGGRGDRMLTVTFICPIECTP